MLSEKQFNSKATSDAFDEIYSNHDISVNDDYNAGQGYPFDYPTRWLNDPSMNKRIAIRRLNVVPSSHSFSLRITAQDQTTWTHDENIEVTKYDTLLKVMGHMKNMYCQTTDANDFRKSQFMFQYDTANNKLTMNFFSVRSNANCKFKITAAPEKDTEELNDFLRFLNQEPNDANRAILTTPSTEKVFYEVWDRDALQFHASFSTSKRKFIGLRNDFYMIPSVLYPAPTNESTFFIRFTSNGTKNILLRYCDFCIQLCFIVNFKKATVV